MDVTPLIREGQQIIQSYDRGVFKISAKSYDHAVLVAPNQTQMWKGVSDFDSLKFESFEPLIAMSDEIDVLLLGAGAQMKFFDPALKNRLSQHGLPLDVMDTGAACRTYNVLMAEGRRVIAALLCVE